MPSAAQTAPKYIELDVVLSHSVERIIKFVLEHNFELDVLQQPIVDFAKGLVTLIRRGAEF